MTIAKAVIPSFLVAASLASGPAPDANRQPIPAGTPASAIFADDEDCLYEVRWTIFKLGTVRVKSFRDFRAEAHIDSYEGLPFVDLHSVHFCQMDSLLYCREARSYEYKDDQWWGLEYLPQAPGRTVWIDETYQKTLTLPPTSRSHKNTLVLTDPHFIDGLSIGIFPRRLVHTSQTLVVPTILYGKVGSTTFNFNREVVATEIDAVDRPVRTVEVTGNTDAEGIFGLTGDFAAWFSDDSLSVPIKGEVRVLLGTVTIELKQWDRKGWVPPQMPSR